MHRTTVSLTVLSILAAMAVPAMAASVSSNTPRQANTITERVVPSSSSYVQSQQEVEEAPVQTFGLSNSGNRITSANPQSEKSILADELAESMEGMAVGVSTPETTSEDGETKKAEETSVMDLPPFAQRYPPDTITNTERAEEVIEAYGKEIKQINAWHSANEKPCYRTFLVNRCLSKVKDRVREKKNEAKAVWVVARDFIRKEKSDKAQAERIAKDKERAELVARIDAQALKPKGTWLVSDAPDADIDTSGMMTVNDGPRPGVSNSFLPGRRPASQPEPTKETTASTNTAKEPAAVKVESTSVPSAPPSTTNKAPEVVSAPVKEAVPANKPAQEIKPEALKSEPSLTEQKSSTPVKVAPASEEKVQSVETTKPTAIPQAEPVKESVPVKKPEAIKETSAPEQKQPAPTEEAAPVKAPQAEVQSKSEQPTTVNKEVSTKETPSEPSAGKSSSVTEPSTGKKQSGVRDNSVFVDEPVMNKKSGPVEQRELTPEQEEANTLEYERREKARADRVQKSEEKEHALPSTTEEERVASREARRKAAEEKRKANIRKRKERAQEYEKQVELRNKQNNQK